MKKLFSRQPRVLPDMPQGNISIPNPPQMPGKPEISWFGVVVPPMVMLTITVLVALSMASMFMMLSIAMTVMTLITSLTNAANQIRKFKKNKAKREQLYLQFIKDKRGELDIIRNKQQTALVEMFPSPNVCLERIRQVDNQLFEKTPVFNDFLSLRIGIGNMPLSVGINYEQQSINMESDPLMGEPSRLAGEFTQVKDVPVVLDLCQGGVTGITGENDLRLKVLDTMLLQLLTHHGYDDVKIVVLSSEKNLDKFKWLKSSYHVWDKNLQNRYILCGKGMAHQTLAYLYGEIYKRAVTEGMRKITPHYVFIVDDETLLENELINKYVYNNHKDIGVYAIFMADTKAYLPMNCEIFAHIGRKSGELIIPKTNAVIHFTPDEIDGEQLAIAGLIMPTIEIKSVQGSFEVPESITLNDLYHIKETSELPVTGFWNKSRTYQGMGVLIGQKSGGKDVYLDLHETGHGPHGLVAGTTGSGKSELLQSIIISLAINFHPHDLAFVLIDYKGGGMADVFKGMPHLVGTITNLGGNETNRALLSINSEIKKRQRILSDYGVSNIDKYQKLFYMEDDAQMPKLPHLIMIADEFAELKQDQPDFMKELVSAARVGRSLGVHLILATQKPAGIVDDQIWSNSKFKICLKVQDVSDSNDVLKKPDAAMIKRPGRAFMQVGNDEIYELFQSAYSGADYKAGKGGSAKEEGEKEEAASFSPKIYSVALNGKTDKIYPMIEEKIVEKQYQSQLEAMVEYITKEAQAAGIEALEGPWKPSLLKKIPLDVSSLDRKVEHRLLSREIKNIVIPLGQYDNPREQDQGVFNYDMNNDGNLLVYGGAGNGKSHLFMTMMVSASLKYHSEELIFYCLDFAGGTLKKTQDLPLCGDVITLEEEEKIKHLIFKLNKIQKERKALFNEFKVNDIEEYVKQVGPMPIITVIIDNYYGLSETYEGYEEELLILIREGLRFGLYFCASVTNPSIIRYKVSVNFKSVVTFELSDSGEYTGIVGRCDELSLKDIKGRCLVKDTMPYEAQIYDYEVDEMPYDEMLHRLNEEHNHLGAKKAEAIPVMEEFVDIKICEENKQLVVGKDFNTLEPVHLSLESVKGLMVLGDGGTYKTDLVLRWFTVLKGAKRLDEFEFYGIDSKNMELYNFIQGEHCTDLADEESVEDITFTLKEKLDGRKTEFFQCKREDGNLSELLKSWKQIVIVVNGVTELTQSDQYTLIEFLETVMRDYYQLKVVVIGIDRVSELASNYDQFAKLMQAEQTGILLEFIKEQNIFNVKVPYNYVENLKSHTDGYLITNNKFDIVRFGV